ncbi:MAG: hypothetical protein RMK29_09920 [Myxococcales bacterium]|nr:UV damage endonuclease UvsE [Myxococcota bacterium]MDW8282019.1 hypothetical protein [Myxococcales bacterium]
MTPQLGLVCLSAGPEVRFRTTTRAFLHRHRPCEAQQLLRALYRDNLARLERAFAFCASLGISLYRMPSSLFPFADAEGAPLLEELAEPLAALGRQARQQGLRLLLHPDQFVVLSSDSAATVRNAHLMLAMQGRLMDLLDQPRSPWAAINIHGGKAGRLAALVREIRSLPDAVRTRLTLENDERAYGSAEILEACQQAGVPMVFDAHHHLVHDRLSSYDDPSIAHWLAAARQSWPDPSLQVVHISNGRDHLQDARHSDWITHMPTAYRHAPWIEVEAKAKDEAIRRLRQRWRPLRARPSGPRAPGAQQANR